MPNKRVRGVPAVGYVPANCFYDPNHVLMVRSDIYEHNGPREGLLREEVKGRVSVAENGEEFFIGQIAVFCTRCYELFCGPRPTRTFQQQLDIDEAEFNANDAERKRKQ